VGCLSPRLSPHSYGRTDLGDRRKHWIRVSMFTYPSQGAAEGITGQLSLNAASEELVRREVERAAQRLVLHGEAAGPQAAASPAAPDERIAEPLEQPLGRQQGAAVVGRAVPPQGLRPGGGRCAL
jgi:hypothetical protein